MDIAQIEKNIKVLREKKCSCSQATLLGIAGASESALPDEKTLSAIASGLRGGIGATRDEGTCGALTAGVVALGLLFPDNNLLSTKLSRQLYEDFKHTFSTVICGKMIESTGQARCTECCLCAGRKVAQLYNQYSTQSTQETTL